MTVEVLDFQAEWCGPCKQQEPILEDLEEEYEDDDVEFEFIDIEEDMETANQYGVQAVPTLVILNDDEVQTQMTGLQQEDDLREQIESAR